MEIENEMCVFCVSVPEGSRIDPIHVTPPPRVFPVGFSKKERLRSEELKHFNILPGELPRVLISEKNFDFFIEDRMFLRKRGPSG